MTAPVSTRAPGTGARRLLADARCLVDGRWVEGAGGPPVLSVDPYTEQPLGQLTPCDAVQVDDAVAAARRAFDDGRWSGLPGARRRELLHRAANALAAHRDELVEIAVAEIGCPIALTRALQVDAAIEHWRWQADAAERGPVGGYEQRLPPHPGPPVGSESLLVREPVGVVAAVLPYNIPLLTAAWKAGAALAAGCTVVLLAAPRAQLLVAAFVRVLTEAGFPDGVLNLVAGGPDVGRALTGHPHVDLVTFTGSTAVGRQVLRQAADGVTRVILELGGKSPNVVLPGADLDTVVGPSVLRFTRNSGQACGATTRTFVPRADHDRYAEGVRAVFAGLRVGDPWDPATVMGPLITAEHRARVEGYVERAIAAGGRLVAGGGRPDLPHGYFMNPALVAGVGNDAEISCEELFGPVAVLVPYDSVDDAIAMANASPYGLGGNVWGPPDAALEVARRIRSGTVTVNGGGGLRPDGPAGGYRDSGMGRESGEAGFAEFFEVKHLQWPAG